MKLWESVIPQNLRITPGVIWVPEITGIETRT
jgi:hypothetical protein